MAKLPVSVLWNNIPAELQKLNQWLLGSADKTGALKVPTSVSVKGGLCPGSSTDRSTWLPFDVAVDAAIKYKRSLGFVLSKNDPYCVVDMDVKNVFNEPDPLKRTSQATLDGYDRVVVSLNSYAERSLSGHGIHVWVHADIGAGARRDGVEIYSQERFIVCTGRIIENKPIADRQVAINQIMSEMTRARCAAQPLVDTEETESDETILARAENAANGEKFSALWHCSCSKPLSSGKKEMGSFVDLGYESQSEADFALMSMIAFYSGSNAQCKRLFRMSGLGQREKAIKNDRYLNATLTGIRSREVSEHLAQVDTSNLLKQLSAF